MPKRIIQHFCGKRCVRLRSLNIEGNAMVGGLGYLLLVQGRGTRQSITSVKTLNDEPGVHLTS